MNNKEGGEQLLFLDRHRIISAIEKIKHSMDTERSATIQIQLNLKGYDPRKDNKISKDMIFPYKVRNDDKIVVIADEARSRICQDANIPYALIEDLVGEEKTKNRIRNDIFKRNKYFIMCPGYNKVYQLKNILRAGKTPYIVKSDDDIRDVFEAARKSYKFRIKDFAATSFPVGHTGMDPEQVYENVKTGMTLVISYLKKGLQSLNGVFIKATLTKPIVIY